MRLSTIPRFNVAILAGNKYGFRSGYIPIIRQLDGAASVHIYLLDFPVDDDISPSLEKLRTSGLIESYRLIPDNQMWLSHQMALIGAAADLKQKELDILVIDADTTPMHRYLIKVARSANALVLGVLKEVPITLMSYYAALSESTESQNAGQSGDAQHSSGYQLIRRFRRLAQRPGFVASVVLNRCKRAYKLATVYWVLPLVLSGQVFKIPGKYESIGHYSSRQVDAAIVYDEQSRKALEHFFPWVNVIVAQHPLAQNCRCDDADTKTRLLVALGAPWVHWIAQDNTADMIEERWCEAVLKSISLRGFTSVDIRPHPRETAEHPNHLAQRLVELGINARVRDINNESVPEIMCEYAGVISSPSSVLAEGVISCRRAFAIGIQDLNQVNDPIMFQSAVDGVVWKKSASDLTLDDFANSSVDSASSTKVADVIANLLALKTGSSEPINIAAR